jgi:tetratricopeptide (TPR) repeat protein
MNHTSAVELEVERIRGLVTERRFTEALQAAGALQINAPENRDVLYLRALTERRLGDIPAALVTLATFEQHHPRFSLLHQERGQCYVALKRAPEAIGAFVRAVQINPALPASWSMLEGLYRMTGQAEEAAQAAQQVATLKKLPADVVTATALFSDGDLATAEPLVRACGCSHALASRGRSLTMRSCCWRPCSISRLITPKPGSSTRRCSTNAVCTCRHSSRPNGCLAWIRQIETTARSTR